MNWNFNGLLMKVCYKKQESLNRQDAKNAKFKMRSIGIVQNWVTVLDKAAFLFAATRHGINSSEAGMIRYFNSRDMDKVLDIWLRASVKAHDFVDGKFWEARLEDIRDMYIPDSDFRLLAGSKMVNWA